MVWLVLMLAIPMISFLGTGFLKKQGPLAATVLIAANLIVAVFLLVTQNRSLDGRH